MNTLKILKMTKDGIRYTDANTVVLYSTLLDPKSYLDRNVEIYREYVDAWEKHEIFPAVKIKNFRDMINTVEQNNNEYFGVREGMRV